MNEHDKEVARFRARVNLHQRTGWSMVYTHSHPFDITLHKDTIGSAQATGYGGIARSTLASAPTRSSFRRIYVDREGKVQVRLVSSLPRFYA